MNFGPALHQQKVVVITGLIIIAIIAAGSWYVVSNQEGAEQYLPGSAMPATDAPSADAGSSLVPAGEMSIRVSQAAPTANPDTFVLTATPTGQPLTGLELRLLIPAGDAATTVSKFATSSELTNEGWQSVVNSTSTNESGQTVVEISYLNLSPDGWMGTEPLEIGTLTVSGVAMSDLTIDQEVSSAFTKNGEVLKLNLVVEPTITE